MTTVGEALADKRTVIGRAAAKQSAFVAERKNWSEAQWLAYFNPQGKAG